MREKQKGEGLRESKGKWKGRTINEREERVYIVVQAAGGAMPEAGALNRMP
jgi:hypothetical protein